MRSKTIESPICNICLEPIYHFICSDCLHEQVKEWLGKNASYLIPEVEEIVQNIKENLLKNRENRVYCIHCKEEKTGFVCPYCFIREIYFVLKNIDKQKADELAQTFDFDFQRTGFYSIKKDVENFESIIEIEQQKLETGICENCELFQDELRMFNGEFLCEDCLSDKLS
ncbi:MAG: hypothetical protein ABEK17_04395 [Candidatus Aenigmatarchaeota archaeon]